MAVKQSDETVAGATSFGIAVTIRQTTRRRQDLLSENAILLTAGATTRMRNNLT